MRDRALRRRKLNGADHERGDGCEGVNLDYRAALRSGESVTETSEPVCWLHRQPSALTRS
jgi:hypothetical protein